MFYAAFPQSYSGQAVGTGQCVAFVERACNAPLTVQWRQGAKVKSNLFLPPGTAIATFDPNGTYGNHTDGRSHAAIYMGQDANGLWVWDQWLNQPAHMRTIRFQGGAPGVKQVNDGDFFYVVEVASAPPATT